MSYNDNEIQKLQSNHDSEVIPREGSVSDKEESDCSGVGLDTDRRFKPKTKKAKCTSCNSRFHKNDCPKIIHQLKCCYCDSVDHVGVDCARCLSSPEEIVGRKDPIKKPKGNKGGKKNNLVAGELIRAEQEIKGGFDALKEKRMDTVLSEKKPPEPWEKLDPHNKASVEDYDESWYEPIPNGLYNLCGLAKARVHHRMVHLDNLEPVNIDFDARSENISGTRVKYPDPDLQNFEYSRSFQVKFPFSNWKTVQFPDCLKNRFFWCGKEKANLIVSTQYVSQISVHANLSPLFDSETAWNRINNSSKSLTAVNLDKNDVWYRYTISQDSSVFSYFLFNCMRYDQRKMHFPRTPAIDTPLRTDIDTVICGCQILALLSLMLLLSIFVTTTYSIALLYYGVWDVMYWGLVYPIQILMTPLLWLLEFVRDLCVNHLPQTPVSLNVILSSFGSGLRRILDLFLPIVTLVLILGWAVRLILYGGRLNCSVRTKILAAVSIILMALIIPTVMLNLSKKMNVIRHINMGEQSTVDEMNLSVKLDQFSSSLKKSFLNCTGSSNMCPSEIEQELLFRTSRNLDLESSPPTTLLLRLILLDKLWRLVSSSYTTFCRLSYLVMENSWRSVVMFLLVLMSASLRILQ
jgi:hypothetical protein